VGDKTIFANNASIAGHVRVGDYAILGGFTAVHQFCLIGAHSMCAMFSYVTKDVPAYVTISGRPAEPRGINAEGLKRRNFTPDQIRNIREAYRVVFRQSLKLDEAVTQLAALVDEQPEIKPFLDSLRDGSRGLAR
jgi:UDP-N-acetylglucosamine acyltransferase